MYYPTSDDYSPHLNSPLWGGSEHSFSSAASSPLLSPLTAALNDFAIGESFPEDSYMLPSGTRPRSSSYTAGTVPPDNWSAGRARSVSVNGLSTSNNVSLYYGEDQGSFSQYNESEHVIQVQTPAPEVNSQAHSPITPWASYPPESGMNSAARPSTNGQGNAYTSLDQNYLSPHVQTAQQWGLEHGPVAAPAPTRHSYSRSLSALPPDVPQSSSHLTVPSLQRRDATRRRSYSDINAQFSLGNRSHSRQGASSELRPSLSRMRNRRQPPSDGTPELQLGEFNAQSIYLDGRPDTAFDNGVSDGSSLDRRHSYREQGSEPFLDEGSDLARAVSDPSFGRVGRRRKAPQAPSPIAGCAVFKAEPPSEAMPHSIDGSTLMQPQDSQIQVVSSSTAHAFKVHVASNKIIAASNARRLNQASFECPVPGCPSTFTARHNLKSESFFHILH